MEEVLHSLLEKSAVTFPDKSAVKFNDKQISYRQLNELSGSLAFCLLEQGVISGSRVGLYAGKAIESVAAVFGVLKAGGCYVPLDLFSPVERLKLIIDDCSLEYIVAAGVNIAKLKRLLLSCDSLRCVFLMDIERRDINDDFPGVKVVFKDQVPGVIPAGLKLPAVKGSDRAYILYTSGSTGIPKGVVITHSASLAFVRWVCSYIGVSADDRIPAYNPFIFDLSVLELYAAFNSGATLHIVPAGISAFPEALADFIARERITLWYSVPTVLIRLLLQGRLERKDISALRKIIFAGEVFAVKYLRRLMQAVPRADFYNFYGPTETNVCISYRVLSPPEGDKPVPIGRPYAGEEVFVLDDNRAPVGEGEKGELYVSGPTLMEGYWNDPVKTSEVLFTNPFGGGKGKLYKTGDIVSIRNDGNLEYHGRNDAMIKSRGYRVEPGEIESVLAAHPGIKEAVVFGSFDALSGSRLKAVVVVACGAALSQAEVKAYCSSKLPQYMLPEELIFTEHLPRTHNGKVDRMLIGRMYGALKCTDLDTAIGEEC